MEKHISPMEAKMRVENVMGFGNVPKFSVKAGRKYVYVCKNDGYFHKSHTLSGQNGYATFLGKFLPEDAIAYFLPGGGK